jgi:hypothetical protein
LNWAEDSASAFPIRALCIKGGQWAIGDATTRTDTTQQAETTPFTPTAMIVCSHNKAQSTADTTQADDERSVGFVVSPTDRNYVSVMDKDNVADSDIGVADGTDAMYGNQSTAATIATEGLMDLVSLDATPAFTWVMDDADPVASFFWYVIAAEVAVPKSLVVPPNPMAALLVR